MYQFEGVNWNFYHEKLFLEPQRGDMFIEMVILKKKAPSERSWDKHVAPDGAKICYLLVSINISLLSELEIF